MESGPHSEIRHPAHFLNQLVVQLQVVARPEKIRLHRGQMSPSLRACRSTGALQKPLKRGDALRHLIQCPGQALALWHQGEDTVACLFFHVCFYHLVELEARR